MKMKSIARSGAEGNTRLLSKYGGGSSGPRQHYASGGRVQGKALGGEVDDEEMMEGDEAAPRLDRPSRKKGESKTTVNVIVASKGDQPMPPMGPMAGPPPPMPPVPPGGPPPMMRKNGGRVVTRKAGGRVGKAHGGGLDLGSVDQPTASNALPMPGSGPVGFVGDAPAGGFVQMPEIGPPPADKSSVTMRGPLGAGASAPPPIQMGEGPMGAMGGAPPMPMMRKSGGRVGVVKMDAGGGGAKGRLEKIKAYGK